jgi:hypothetical protein
VCGGVVPPAVSEGWHGIPSRLTGRALPLD